MAETASFQVGQSGESFTLALTSVPPTFVNVAGDTITWEGNIGTYDFIFSAVAPLTFGSPPVVTIPNLDGVTFSMVASSFTSFTLEVNISMSLPSEAPAYTVPFTINTSQGPFDPSIVIDPPPIGP